ncbi:helix-turn-helix transcriptional regulator [Patulibacter minatonensis]|uniref:helix-turn-helix transcriptional regulator n=1 Tax=Patulibacter minatonensis TaxID=298163 RepID=UPI0004791A0D|nr:helix-turn-helix transcriptional regulator [Patulibacter minatonensis]
MPDPAPTGLGAAVARLLAEVEAAVPGEPGELPAPDVATASGGPALLAAGGRLAAALGGELPPADRAALSSLLARTDALDDRVRAAGRDAAVARRDGFERGLLELRACASVAELMDRLAPIMCDACGAARVSVGIVDDGTWTPIREADRGSGDGRTAPDVLPTALAELTAERTAFITASPTVVEAIAAAEGRAARPASVIAPTFIGGRARGLFRAEFDGAAPTPEDVAAVERMGRALGHAFEMLEMHERLLSVDRTVERLRETVGERGPDDERSTAQASFGRPAGGGVVRSRSASGTDARAPAELTPRQRQTLDLMLLGMSNAQIAERLVVGVPTVKSHVSAILRAVGAVNRAEAIGRYLERDDT